MNRTDDDVVDHAEGAAKDEVDDEDGDDSVDRREKWSEADDDRTKCAAQDTATQQLQQQEQR